MEHLISICCKQTINIKHLFKYIVMKYVTSNTKTPFYTIVKNIWEEIQIFHIKSMLKTRKASLNVLICSDTNKAYHFVNMGISNILLIRHEPNYRM